MVGAVCRADFVCRTHPKGYYDRHHRIGPYGAGGCYVHTAHLEQGPLARLHDWYGASMSDLAYAAVTAFGMSFVFDFINNAHNMFVLQVVGREAEARKLENRTDITLAALWNSMLRSMLRQP